MQIVSKCIDIQKEVLEGRFSQLRKLFFIEIGGDQVIDDSGQRSIR